LGRPTSATRRGPPSSSKRSRGRLGQRVEDSVEQVAAAAAVQRADRVRLAEAERPQLGGVGLAALVVDLVGHQDHRPVAAAQHAAAASSVSVAPTVASTTNTTDVGGLHRVLGLRGDRAPRPVASGSQPPVSTTVNRGRSTARRRRSGRG
jgi:hypothetical protein